jgi:Zn-dependent M28 family amino/carboxypeptidase
MIASGRRHERASHALGFAAFALLALPSGCQSRTTVHADGARALARVVHQVDAGPRIPGTPGHDAIEQWIAAELGSLGATVERQTFVDSTLGHPLTLTNVIGRYGPASGRRLGLFAHWDSRPWCDQDPDTSKRRTPLPGANDGGSGVAVLLEVAEQLKKTPPPCGVELVFLDGEDLGTSGNIAGYSRGSRAYAARATAAPGGPIAAGFVFDMIGDKELSIHPDIRSARDAANLTALVYDAARAVGARHFHPDPRWDVFDDHVPLLDAGIPAVDIIDFDYPAWHTARDLPDQVSAPSLAEVADVAVWLVTKSPLALGR